MFRVLFIIPPPNRRSGAPPAGGGSAKCLMFYVYAIYNRKHNKIYIGQTNDLISRLELHNNGKFKGSYTARFDGIWESIYNEEVEDRKAALVREKQLKTYKGRQFLKQYIPVWRNGSADAC